jgi:hypothetical protein
MKARALCRIAAVVLVAAGGGPSFAAPWAAPDRVFLQLGRAQSTSTVTVGAGWDWSWRRQWTHGDWSGHTEASVGRWLHSGSLDRRESDNTQLGLTPTLRFTSRTGRWWLEGGIGANVITPRYAGNGKRFSTRFNFGDHIAWGWRFGPDGRVEVSLRLQHFSNASIRKPNPGEDFVQLRVAWRPDAR